MFKLNEIHIALLNFTGNAGKSMLANQLFKPRIKNSKVIAVESINSDGTENEKIKGGDFTLILDQLYTTDAAILDIGSSNIESFLKKMNEFIGSENDIDLYIIPTVNEDKQIVDTVKTIEALSFMGIPKERIIVIFNKINKEINIKLDFESIFEMENKATILVDSVIYQSELFPRLINEEDNRIIRDIASDTTDYRKLIKAEPNSSKRLSIIRKLGTQALALGVSRNMDNVFNLIFPETTTSEE